MSTTTKRDTVAAVRTDLTSLVEQVEALASPEEVQAALNSTFEHVDERLTTLEERVGRIADFLNAQVSTSAPSAPTEPTEPTPQPAANAPAKTESGIRCGKCSTREQAVYHATPTDVKQCYTLAS